MKSIIRGQPKCRVSRSITLAAVLAAGGLWVAWPGPVHHQLGGSFIGRPADSGGMSWSAFQAPLDPAGKTAALRVAVYSYSAESAFLLTMSGADTLTEGLGQLAMVSNDTARGSLVFHGLAQGNPPLVKQIWIWEGIIRVTGPDAYDVIGQIHIYSAESDFDGDGRPDPNSVPLLTVPYDAAVTRVLP